VSDSDRRARRRRVLVEFGAAGSEVDELLEYNDNVFDADLLPSRLQVPLEDEEHVGAWSEYAESARAEGVFSALASVLPQLNFPVRAGISSTEGYVAATRTGHDIEHVAEATGLQLEDPQGLQLRLSASPGGRVPVIIPATRADFVTLLQALSMRNEPGEVFDTQGAVTIGGYNNWDRVRRHRERWQAENPFDDWSEEFTRLVPRKELYQDRFIILSVGPYGRVPADDLGLSEDEWHETSLAIRMHHECTHYFTWRLFSSMRNRALDEILADYMGMVGAIGEFRVDWACHFFGVHGFPHHQVGRLRRYRGTPPLSDGAFNVLHGLVYAALQALGKWDAGLDEEYRTPEGRAIVLLALTSMTVEEMASDDAGDLLAASLQRAIERGR